MSLTRARLRIGFTVTRLSFFTENRIELAQALVKKGHEVWVFAGTHGASPEGLKALEEKGIHWKLFNCTRTGVRPFEELRTLFELWALYRETRCTLIHHFALKPIVYGTFLSMVTARSRVVNSLTGLGYVFIDGSSKKRQILRFLISLLFKFWLKRTKAHFIFQNPDDLEFFVSQGLLLKKQTHLVLGSGIDTNYFIADPKIQRKSRQVVLPARLLYDKGIEEAVKATEILQKKEISIQLLLAGPVDPENPAHISESQVRIWEKAGLCQWLGQVKDIRSLYQSSAVTLLPSYREGIPRVLLEALSCECPVVTTDVPGCREVVRNGQTGFLVPARNPEALAETLIQVFNHPEEALRTAQTGKQRVHEMFSKEKVIEQTLQVYQLG